MYCVGQALLGKVSFVDGKMPAYARPYLIVEVMDDGVNILNVSSTKGKEHKLLYTTNYKLKKFKPPFTMSSFVKLDSKTFVRKSDLQNMKTLSDGEVLNSVDLQEIISKYIRT